MINTSPMISINHSIIFVIIYITKHSLVLIGTFMLALYLSSNARVSKSSLVPSKLLVSSISLVNLIEEPYLFYLSSYHCLPHDLLLNL